MQRVPKLVQHSMSCWHNTPAGVGEGGVALTAGALTEEGGGRGRGGTVERRVGGGDGLLAGVEGRGGGGERGGGEGEGGTVLS
jgi:hypothetical protein